MNRTIGILPAAGKASRIGGIPKFMLPLSNLHPTLLSFHLGELLAVCDFVLIPTRPEWVELVQSVAGDDSRTEVFGIYSQTMSETVARSLGRMDWDWAILGLPDTYVSGGISPYSQLAERASTLESDGELALLLTAFHTHPNQIGQVGSVEIGEGNLVTQHADKQESANFGNHWGQMAFRTEALRLLSSESPHTGHMIDPIIQAGGHVEAVRSTATYLDCGTLTGYRAALDLANHP